MKIRSLLLGSVAAAGLSTGGAYAADLGVLTSLDVCDELGLSGLTISSDTNCLQITGEVKYKFTWGDYRDDTASPRVDFARADHTDWDAGNGAEDWESRFDAWIKFVATANSDFGPAKAVLKLKEVSSKRWQDRDDVTTTGPYFETPSDSDGLFLDEAYVSIGDATVIMAGKKGSILKTGDDEPLNWLGLFNSSNVDTGVGWMDNHAIGDGGHVIQVVSDLGNGFSIAAGLENLAQSDYDTEEDYPAWYPEGGYSRAGTAVGVISYAGDGISAHVSVAAAGVLDGEIEEWGVHAGFAGSFDNFKVVLAGAYYDRELLGFDPYWNVLASASATFDMFTIAGSVEATSEDEWGVGASLSAGVADGITVKVGGRYFEETGGDDIWQVAAGVEAAVTESITLTGEVGYVEDTVGDLFYGSAALAWAPGGGYTSSIKGTVNTADAYKIETEFKKTFE
jgi:hypothetical protein